MASFAQWIRPASKERLLTGELRHRTTNRRRQPRCHLGVEALESRTLLSSFRSVDGYGNNALNPTWGQAGTDLLRISPVAYADGISSPSLSGPNNPSARLASDLISNQANPLNPSADLQTVDQNSLSDFGYVWGQFIDHDMDLTPGGGASFPIPVPPGDPIGPNPLPFTRSQFDPNTGITTPRQQINAITSYLDLSQVYGSSQAVSDALRTFQGGQLKTSPGNMLPYDNTKYFTKAQIAALNMANDAGAVATGALFATGDVRGNENIELTAMQTLFVRNHNRIAAELQAANPSWTDEQLYQEARKLNIAEEEMITYTEWIPAVLGPDALPEYQGYDPGSNASIATEFSTVAFRFGHSLLSSNIERHGNDGQDIPGDPTGSPAISLAQDFFDPKLLNPKGVVDHLTGHISSDIGPILKGDADGDSQAMDVLAIGDVRNLLFGNGGLGGQDLIARDIQRARDHGIGTYNQLRVAYGLPAVTSFRQITRNLVVQQELAAAYGSVDNIDPFEGGLAEDHVRGSDVGPLFQAIMAKQFAQLRDGDSFFYLNESFTPQEQAILQQGDTLARVIEANTNITNLQSDVFLFKASLSGTVYLDLNGDGQRESGEPGVAAVVVQLQDTSGDGLATTVTDRHGHYQFNQLSGPANNSDIASGASATGLYNVVLLLPPLLTQTTPNLGNILISRGDLSVSGLDIGVILNPREAPNPGAANLAAPASASLQQQTALANSAAAALLGGPAGGGLRDGISGTGSVSTVGEQGAVGTATTGSSLDLIADLNNRTVLEVAPILANSQTTVLRLAALTGEALIAPVELPTDLFGNG
jgi:hypothetical protein